MIVRYFLAIPFLPRQLLRVFFLPEVRWNYKTN